MLSLLLGGYDRVLAFTEDDASYYFVIAENIVKTSRSTFDGVTTTTGYHPLWLLLNVALAWLSGVRHETWLAGLVVVCACLSLAQAALLQRLLQRFAPSSPWLVSGLVLLVTAWSLRFSFSGMECALATPLLIGCALALHDELEASRPTDGRAIRVGLLAALCGLARVDALLFGLGCGAVALFARRRFSLGSALRFGALFALGLLPFAIYLGINYQLSGSLLTTSAQAKSLASSFAWNFGVFSNVSRTGQAAVVLCLLGALLVASPATPWRGPTRAVALVSFAFPLVYYASLAARSSWSIWSWYLYPIPLALPLALAAIGEAARLRLQAAGFRAPPWGGTAGLALSFVGALAAAIKFASEDGNNADGRDTARTLAQFAASHGGRYAMGDRAGLTAFLSPSPYLQLEGLVADRELLEDIRRERPLREVLQARHVDYLVETVPVLDAGGSCLHVAAPKARQAGALSPKMRGIFCDPVAVFPDKFGWVKTLIFAIEPPPTARAK
jgi:hypothetical protein